MQIQWIQEAIKSNRVKITDHADEEAQEDGLLFNEVFDSVFHGEIIETYTEDKPYPSCLVYGNSFKKEPIHSVWAYNQENGWVILVTVYRPDPKKWVHWKERKK